MTVTGYQVIEESQSGILSYPAIICSATPCDSWNIDTSSALSLTFKVQVSTSLGATFKSNLVTVTIASSSAQSPILQPSDISSVNGMFLIGDTRLLEIDKF